MKPVRTDEQLASELRRHIQAALSIKKALNDRGYAVLFRGASGYSYPAHETVEIKKEVTL